jgi:predicted transglutaminase-like cysteine proteinase
MKAVAHAALAAAVLVCGCGQMPDRMAGALPDSGLRADSPPGFLSFCMRFADQRDPLPGKVSTISLDKQNWRVLDRINHAVNTSIWPEDDKRHYGQAEYWTIPTDGYGDCDDYAVTKRKDLLDAGFSSSDLRLAVVLTSQGERHAVLTVTTDKGDLVLDNLTDDIRPWNATGFTWIERQDAADPAKWVSLQPILTAQLSNLPVAGTSAQVPAKQDQAKLAASGIPVEGAGSQIR